ncbi:MAG TPA: hypothetical protein VHO24_04265 [Opitutaceae bacterium]|nr:hypothetical protein [Opitutaceae bacterium]
MNRLLRACVALIFTAGASAGASAAADNGSAIFSLLPKAFQKNPRVDFNVITEMTPDGRQAPQPSPQSPIYYVSTPGSFVQRGHGSPAREKPPAVERMEGAMEAALAKRGYLRGTKENPATIVIVYTWGSHSAPDPEDPESPATISNRVLIDEMLERARLVGGDKFANELIRAMEEEGSVRRATPKPREDPTGEIPAQPNIMGDIATMPSLSSPLERFRRKNTKHESMMEDAGNSIYFVVASAVTFSSTKPDTKILLWRTKMTVNASGLSLPETLPSLVAAAGPFLGREMSEPEIIHQRVTREGKVEVGAPTVVSDNEAAKPNAPVKPAAPAKK